MQTNERPIVITDDKGKEIWWFLRDKLGIPPIAQKVVITLQMNNVIHVSCDFIASAPEEPQ